MNQNFIVYCVGCAYCFCLGWLMGWALQEAKKHNAPSMPNDEFYKLLEEQITK